MTDRLAGLYDDWIDAARIGRTWPMLFVKQALSPLPTAEAFSEFVQALRRPPASTLTLKELMGVRPFAERSAAFFSEIEPGGNGFVNVPPRVVGESDDRLLAHTTRSLYLAAFNGVTVRGRSQLIEFPDRVLLDFEGEESACVDDEIELDSAIFRRDGKAVLIIDEPPADTIFAEQCFSLLGPNTYAFGHWIVEYLPRLWIALESGLMPPVPILIDQGMSAQHRQCLELIVPPGTRIIEVDPMQRVETGKLWFAPTFYYAPIYPQFNERFRYDMVAAPPDRFQRIFRGMLARMAPMLGPTHGAEKIYLARKPGSHRKLVNHLAIEQVARQEGFRCVYLEDIAFIDQLRLIRRAKYLVGPEGSAFFLGFFARTGTRVCILNHPHTEYLTTVTALLEAVDVDCTVLTGPFDRVEPGGYVHHSDYSIDAECLRSFLRKWSQ